MRIADCRLMSQDASRPTSKSMKKKKTKKKLELGPTIRRGEPQNQPDKARNRKQRIGHSPRTGTTTRWVQPRNRCEYLTGYETIGSTASLPTRAEYIHIYIYIYIYIFFLLLAYAIQLIDLPTFRAVRRCGLGPLPVGAHVGEA